MSVKKSIFYRRISLEMKDVIAESEDVKAQLCFVTIVDRSAKLEFENPPASPPDVKYDTARMFEVPGTVTEKAFEVLWEMQII